MEEETRVALEHLRQRMERRRALARGRSLSAGIAEQRSRQLVIVTVWDEAIALVEEEFRIIETGVMPAVMDLRLAAEDRPSDK